MKVDCIFVEVNRDIITYYSDRAEEYEEVYSKPERQDDLTEVTKVLQKIFSNKHVFEIACGTGYWTEKIAASASTILATDINNAVIEIAKEKKYSPAKVTFEIADIFKVAEYQKQENLFGGFIWSHIKLEELPAFLDSIRKLVVKGGEIVLMDNNYVIGSNIPIADKDENNNTYQLRKLKNGEEYKVLKNFPHEDLIRKLLNEKASEIDFINLKYYWILRYRNV